jgi:imidazoleglycerol-phosphate dehydratase/histidinol-phosphatase
MKKALFLDRDGTLVIEPPLDYQLDSFEKLEFYPKVFANLQLILNNSDYEIVMVTNQDGLGTASFPSEMFWPVHDFILKTFKNENIIFNDVLIDPSLPQENSPNRKPGLGMMSKFIHGQYDLKNSYVIGDRESDIQLAKNLGSKSIRIASEIDNEADFTSLDWDEISAFILSNNRRSEVIRKTNETAIQINLNLDGSGVSKIDTGLKFFDHMLEQLSKHGNVDLEINVKGDLEVDEHHTIEDVGLALGTAFYDALGGKKGIERYGFLLPMDDCLAQVAIDFGGRPWMVWDVDFKRESIGDVPTEMFSHFFKSFTDTAKCNLNIKAEGENEHHKIESIFKAWARAIKMAAQQNGSGQLPSTKGVL